MRESQGSIGGAAPSDGVDSESGGFDQYNSTARSLHSAHRGDDLA